MASEYEPIGRLAGPMDDEDLRQARQLFDRAARPYLSQPWSWVAWALVLPAAALLTPGALRAAGPSGVLLLWSAAILCAGAVELLQIVRGRRRAAPTALAAWVLRLQGNLSLVGLALSMLLVWQELYWALPGLWLLLIGHSLYGLGGLSTQSLRAPGLFLQASGLVALWPHDRPLEAFAVAAFVGNLWIAWQIHRAGR
jgi:hypothetical protein